MSFVSYKCTVVWLNLFEYVHDFYLIKSHALREIEKRGETFLQLHKRDNTGGEKNFLLLLFFLSFFLSFFLREIV